MSMNAVYGPIAQQSSSEADLAFPIIVFDHIGAGEALKDCVTRSFNGDSFFVRAVLPREFTTLQNAVAPSVFGSLHALDDRKSALEQAFGGTLQVNGRPLRELSAYNPGTLRIMQAAVRLSDGLAVSSSAEFRRIQEVLFVDPHCEIVSFSDPRVPKPQPNGAARDSIVIWAPQLAGDAAATFAVALGDLRHSLLIVSATRPPDSTPGTWCSPPEAATALKRALLVLDTTSHGAEAALALSAWGVTIVCDADSGAQEFLRHANIYDRRHFGSIFGSVIAALGQEPSALAPRVEAISKVEPPKTILTEPLVSIIIPTYDRPTLLRYALESLRRQSYKNIETIVVIDGGPRIDFLADEYPSARFIHMSDNNATVSCNTAFLEANGKYVGFLNDDDLLFPKHVALLTSALERSSGYVAHSDVLTAFLRGDDSEWLLYGLESNMSRYVQLSSLLVSNQIGMISCMFRKDCITDGVAFDETVPLYRDYALWLRLASKFDFIHVERITSCYTIRNQGTSQQSTLDYDKALRSYQVLYEQYPAAARPGIMQQRAQILQSVSAGLMGVSHAVPAAEVTPVLWPPW